MDSAAPDVFAIAAVFNYWSIERLKLLEKASTFFRSADYNERRRALEVERRKVRHLFRSRDRHGRMRWAASWAHVSSVEARLNEVEQAGRPGNPDLFLYGLYVSFSSAVHASPNSLNEVLTVANGRLTAKPQPESDPQRNRFGALLTLMWTIETFASDARLRRGLQPEFRSLRDDIIQLAAYRRAVRH
jgi:hypothetical protein